MTTVAGMVAAAAAEETTVAVGDMEEDINFKWLKEIFLECCPSVDWGFSAAHK